MSSKSACSFTAPRTLFAASLFTLLVVWLLSSPIRTQAPFRQASDGRSSDNCPKHTLILTAHPDDECMFFAPTIISLVSSGCLVSALCLSTGATLAFNSRMRVPVGTTGRSHMFSLRCI